jgi:iron complex outermembrane receptor protein
MNAKHNANVWIKTLLATSVAVSSIAQAESRLGSLIEEVKVMAQKKSAAEAVQDVPISITAYSGDKVDAMFAVNLTDIGLNTPNANLTPMATSPGVANFAIRGMGTVGQSIPSADPAVGVVMDGISYGTIYGVVTDLFDLESIEVLRGPQGTLFGRNVTGGAISMRSTRPGDEFEGRLRATVGSHERKDFSVVVSGPLNDNWGAKLAVLSKDHEGYWDNKAIGGKQGAAESLLVRPALTYQGENFDAALIAEYGDMEGDALGTRLFWTADDGYFADPYKDDSTLQGDKGSSDLEWVNLMLETNWELWDGQLTTVLGYRDLEQRVVTDIDGHVDTLFHFADGTGIDQDQLSLEVRWAGSLTDNVSLTAGVYLFEQEYTYAERRLLLDVVDRRGVSTIDHSTAGIFAQSDINLTDSLVLTLGGRFSTETKDAEVGVIGDPNATGNCATQLAPFEVKASLSDCEPAFFDDEKWNNFSPKVGLTWDVNEDIMAFASYSRGFRSGGYNVRFTDLTFGTPDQASAPGPYNEEVVDALEIGVKSTLMDGKARVNFSLFQNEYDDLQRTVLNTSGGQQILNAATATIQGVEFDAVLMLTDQLVLEGSVGWINAEYDEYDYATARTGKDASAINFNMVPEMTTNAAVTYDMELGDKGALTWRLSYSFVNQTFADDLNTLPVDQYELFDASVVFTNPDENLKVSLFGRNLKDEIYYDFGINVSAIGVRNYYQTPPRTYGLELTYDF